MRLNSRSKKLLILFKIVLISYAFNLQAQTLKDIETHRVTLPNGWQLTPVGKILPLGDLPLNIGVSPSGKFAAITNNGYRHSLQLLDVKRRVMLDSIVIQNAWLGLAFSNDSKRLYVSGGNDNIIIIYDISRKKLIAKDTIIIGKPWPEKISLGGLALDDVKKRIYVVTKDDNSLYVVDIKSKKVISRQPLGGEGYTCVLSPDRKVLYSTCWGCDKVVVFNTEQLKITGEIAVGDNPGDLCVTGDGQLLFVANANENSISVIDLRQMKVIEILNTALYPDSPTGSTPNSVTLSEDEKLLYIANADNNCLAVFDVSTHGTSKSKGFIPTGWYPTCVRVVKNKILVANGKGFSSSANPYGPNPSRRGGEVIYEKDGREHKIEVQRIHGLIKGALSILDVPTDQQMGIYSKAVYNNTPFTKSKELLSEGEQGNPIPSHVGDPSPIKYVFYVIKENRTYDQVLGDMTEGNGDPNLCLFGENITPNHHALAREFVLLDNFYADGEVSADGHNWTMGAYATDYMEKSWPSSYGGKGGNPGGEGTREIGRNKEYLWDVCKRYGITYRTYCEFTQDYDGLSNKANIPVLEGHFCKKFTGWTVSLRDDVRDTTRFYQWRHDFDSLSAIDGVPQFNTIRFFNDHTRGLQLGKPTPFADVADNDLAVGMFVDYLSRSPIWKESLIIIVEDDAQNGPDHVDAHRSIALLAGGYVKNGFVDHTVYTTSSLLRTMELVLGLPPMTQYDAAATPLWRCFDMIPDHPPYKVKPIFIDLNEKNLALNEWQRRSEKFDLGQEDKVNDIEFNEVLWRAVNGLDLPCPPPVHAAFINLTNGQTDKD